ncbi:hypothetical protein G9A89_012622 [Geosiphon pyriformis]|nr:hypothetical protein G9A89_012622 [Geosiphon pyriformis]
MSSQGRINVNSTISSQTNLRSASKIPRTLKNQKTANLRFEEKVCTLENIVPIKQNQHKALPKKQNQHKALPTKQNQHKALPTFNFYLGLAVATPTFSHQRRQEIKNQPKDAWARAPLKIALKWKGFAPEAQFRQLKGIAKVQESKCIHVNTSSENFMIKKSDNVELHEQKFEEILQQPSGIPVNLDTNTKNNELITLTVPKKQGLFETNENYLSIYGVPSRKQLLQRIMELECEKIYLETRIKALQKKVESKSTMKKAKKKTKKQSMDEIIQERKVSSEVQEVHKNIVRKTDKNIKYLAPVECFSEENNNYERMNTLHESVDKIFTGPLIFPSEAITSTIESNVIGNVLAISAVLIYSFFWA